MRRYQISGEEDSRFDEAVQESVSLIYERVVIMRWFGILGLWVYWAAVVVDVFSAGEDCFPVLCVIALLNSLGYRTARQIASGKGKGELIGTLIIQAVVGAILGVVFALSGIPYCQEQALFLCFYSILFSVGSYFYAEGRYVVGFSLFTLFAVTKVALGLVVPGLAAIVAAVTGIVCSGLSKPTFSMEGMEDCLSYISSYLGYAVIYKVMEIVGIRFGRYPSYEDGDAIHMTFHTWIVIFIVVEFVTRTILGSLFDVLDLDYRRGRLSFNRLEKHFYLAMVFCVAEIAVFCGIHGFFSIDIRMFLIVVCVLIFSVLFYMYVRMYAGEGKVTMSFSIATVVMPPFAMLICLPDETKGLFFSMVGVPLVCLAYRRFYS